LTRIGLIGLGAMGRNHLRVLGELKDAELVAVCDLDPAAVSEASRGHQVAGYTSWMEMLAHERLEAAIVAVPTRFHLEVGLAALELGLHILIEKPIAAGVGEGQQLIDAARRAKRVLAIGHIERFNPAVQELQRRLETGEIGRVFQVHARRQGPFPARIRDVGVVIDLATHDLDVMFQLVGSNLSRVFAETEQRIHTEHEDLLNAMLKFENGALGVLQVNWLTPTKIRELSVLGERGMFVANYLTQELTFNRNADAEPRVAARGTPKSVAEGEMVSYPIAKAEPLRLELASFLDTVRSGGRPTVDGEAGLRALQMALALVASASEGRAIGGDELRRLLSPPRNLPG
jgi:UDP-N-acetylglucosamine 3-dehydrogenase